MTLYAKWASSATTTTTAAPVNNCAQYIISSSQVGPCNIARWRDCGGTIQMSSPIGQSNASNCGGYGTNMNTVCAEINNDFPNGPVWQSGGGSITYNNTCS